MKKPISRKNKVLYIHHGRVMGGAPVSLLYMVRGLKERMDVNIKILCAHREIKAYFARNAGVEVGDIYSPYLLLGRLLIGYASIWNVKVLFRAMVEFVLLPYILFQQILTLKKETPDIVHLNSTILVIPALAAKIVGIPVVWHIREYVMGGPHNIRRKLTGKIILSLATRVIAISPTEYEQISPVKNNKIEVVYNFLDVKTFVPKHFDIRKERSKFGFKYGDRIILSLGGVSFRKGTVQILQSIPYLSDRCKVVFAGPKPDLVKANWFKKKVILSALAIEDRLIRLHLKEFYSWFYSFRVQTLLGTIQHSSILFTGPLEDVSHLIAMSDVLVFAGITPHFPRPVYEAWLMKKPVVAFSISGIKDKINNNQNGILVNEITGFYLAMGIKRILQYKNSSKRLAGNGYKKALSHFSLDSNILKIMSVYRDIINI